MGDVSLAFSGGMDSTFITYRLTRDPHRRVHLHTLDHGYGYAFKRWCLKSLQSLQNVACEGQITHRFVRTKALFDRIAMRSLFADRRRYGQGFGCCLGCTMAIITHMVIYNLERTIPNILFGSSVGGEYAVMSMPVTGPLFKTFCGSYGIRYGRPLLEGHITKDVERATLDEAGVFRGHRFLDKHSFGNQGYCMLSLQHLPDVLFNVHPTYDPEQVARFFNDKLPECHRFIREHFEQSGQSIEEAVAALRRTEGGVDAS